MAAANERPAPEYALDEVLDPASDMYSLGCLIYAVHCKGNPPFKNHGNLASLRENAGKPLTGTERLEPDLRGEIAYICVFKPSLNRGSPSQCADHATTPWPTQSGRPAASSLLLIPSCINTKFSRSL